ncbi:AbrB/MazE/SpoVT family DNA-binding domain-containing protein [Candidatus Daviesbacteria bacterium]|nr:AbrB/MazE/SpoVT family DNA-binding domain-containing protein [Candidatus Daviesbacteria bacterium]
MNYTQTIAKIRGRGQLTIPQAIRQALSWNEDEVLVKIITAEDGFRVERLPISHPQQVQKKLTKKQWGKIWQTMEDFSKSGKQNIKLTDFVRKDRDSRF